MAAPHLLCSIVSSMAKSHEASNQSPSNWSAIFAPISQETSPGGLDIFAPIMFCAKDAVHQDDHSSGTENIDYIMLDLDSHNALPSSKSPETFHGLNRKRSLQAQGDARRTTLMDKQVMRDLVAERKALFLMTHGLISSPSSLDQQSSIENTTICTDNASEIRRMIQLSLNDTEDECTLESTASNSLLLENEALKKLILQAKEELNIHQEKNQQFSNRGLPSPVTKKSGMCTQVGLRRNDHTRSKAREIRECAEEVTIRLEKLLLPRAEVGSSYTPMVVHSSMIKRTSPIKIRQIFGNSSSKKSLAKK